MNNNREIPNPMLRAHVSDHSFVLTMRKTHIHTLQQIAHCSRLLGEGRVPGVADFFIAAVNALQRRGLVAHKHHPNFIGKMGGATDEPLTNYYRLTRAGWAVFDLLVEAGLADEIDRRSSLRRLVA